MQTSLLGPREHTTKHVLMQIDCTFEEQCDPEIQQHFDAVLHVAKNRYKNCLKPKRGMR